MDAPADDVAPQVATDDVRLGSTAVQLALKFPEWIERRVEHVSYLDRDTTRTAKGVMFRWRHPGFFLAGAEPQPDDFVYVPLDLLTKAPLTGLQGMRPDGSPFPILPFKRSTELASAGITAVVWGRSIAIRNGRGLEDPDSLRILDAIVRSPPEIAAPLLRVLDDRDSELGQVLKTHSEIRGLLEELAENIMLLAPAKYRPDEEAVYRYTYCEAISRREHDPGEHDPGARRGGELPGKVFALLGYQDVSIRHPNLSFGLSESYHFEVEAPGEARLSAVRLRGKYELPDGSTAPALVAESGGSPIVDLHARRPTELAFGSGEASQPRTRPPILPQLAANATVAEALKAAADARASDTRRSDRGYAEVQLQADPLGTFVAATVVSVLTAILLGVAVTRLPELDGDSSAALLLALPVLTLGFLTRPGEHAFATRLLSGIRAMSLLVGICSLVLAAIVAGGFVDHGTAGPPSYSCKARVDPPASTGSRPRPPIKATLGNTVLRCRPVVPETTATRVAPGAQYTADAAAGLAGLLALILLGGWIATCMRARAAARARMPPKPLAVRENAVPTSS
jgi:hypothetical protein